ncbi:DUF6924 domain-containing protein [Gordonia sputi]
MAPTAIGDALRASDRSYALIADDESMTSADHRLLALSLSVDFDDVESLRVAASQASPVSDNLAIANLSLSDFAAAADADGVYRGQPKYTPPETLTKTELMALAEHNTSTPGLAQFHREVDDLDPRSSLRSQSMGPRRAARKGAERRFSSFANDWLRRLPRGDRSRWSGRDHDSHSGTWLLGSGC